jgi:ribosomal-protein-alanine N-acetyltransferase
MSARREDIDELALSALVDLDRAAFGDDAWSEWTWREAVTSEHRRVRTEVDEYGLAGYVVLAILGDVAELERIAVRDDVRRRGVGRALLRAAVAESGENGADALVLEVRDDNLGARAFYREHEFYEVSRRPGYYARGTVDAVILQMTWVRRDTA